jgi:hypothetical protein
MKNPPEENQLTPGQGLPAPVCSAALWAEAEEAAESWTPISQTHCSSYQKALRDAFASGYASAIESRYNNPQLQATHHDN